MKTSGPPTGSLRRLPRSDARERYPDHRHFSRSESEEPSPARSLYDSNARRGMRSSSSTLPCPRTGSQGIKAFFRHTVGHCRNVLHPWRRLSSSLKSR
jgi:hypothetical protein